MKRRDFLKASCSLCLTLGAGLLTSGISSCSSGTMYKAEKKENTITVPLSLFAEDRFHIIRPTDFEYDIAVQQENDGSFTALLLRCTHASNQLTSNTTKRFNMAITKANKTHQLSTSHRTRALSSLNESLKFRLRLASANLCFSRCCLFLSTGVFSSTAAWSCAWSSSPFSNQTQLN